jgi:hypothetical protein
MPRVTGLRTSGVEIPESADLFGTAEQAAEKPRKDFLQGLKPIGYKSFTPGLKPRPPKEASFSARLPFAALRVISRALPRALYEMTSSQRSEAFPCFYAVI